MFLALGIPAHYFTAMFACARSVGWLAHYLEAKADNRLIRPQDQYCGPVLRTLVSDSVDGLPVSEARAPQWAAPNVPFSL